MTANLFEGPSVAVRRALLSVSDKTGLLDFAKALAAHGVEVSGAWARATAGNPNENGAVYLVVKNLAHDADQLRAVSVAASVAKVAETHTMEQQGGSMMMKKVENGWAVPAEGTLKLEPGEKGPRVHRLQDRLVSWKMLRPDQADGNYGDATQAAVMAFQKAAGIDRDGIDGPKTQKAIDAGIPAPQPFSDGGGDRVEVSLSKQLAQIVKHGEVTRVISISSGRPGFDTPTGRFAVYLKDPNAYSKKYDAPMPLASFFTGSYGLHQSADVPGYAASHGCVRIPAAFAGEVYDFAGMGTPVVIVS